MTADRSDALVFFGATGDLAFKQIFPALAKLVAHGRLAMPIVAVGRKPLALDDLKKRVKESLEASGESSSNAYEALVKDLRYVPVSYEDARTFAAIREAIPGAQHPLHYVALPPETFESVATNLAQNGLADGARLVLEKPFGHDLESAKALSRALQNSFAEAAVFRVDHFLGKEPVQNIAYFRAANPLIEATLDARHVESVQVTMAETFGVKGRAAFYDAAGAIRDVVQNHLFELIACLTLELPEVLDGTSLSAARATLLARFDTLDPKDVVRGQVRGYENEDGVAKGSTTETFVALRLTIGGSRWPGVPFFVRAGKSLPITATEAVIRYRPGAGGALGEDASSNRSHLRFSFEHEPVIALGVSVKKDGQALTGEPAELVLRRDSADAMAPYERLLGDAIDGDASLFVSQEAVEQSWRAVSAVLDGATPVHPYAAGSWGPAEAARISPEGGGWHELK